MQTEISQKRAGRIGAACLFLLAVAVGIGGSRIEYAFSSDPLGPRVVPVGLALILAALSAIYALRPGPSEEWPTGALLGRVLGIPALVAICALTFEPLGFPIAIFILTAGTARIFGVGWTKALVGGVLHAVGWYLVFGYLLEVQVPLGLFSRR